MRLAKLPSVTAWERARDKYYAIEANYIILSMKQEILFTKNGMNYLMNWNRRPKKQRKGTIQPVYQRLRNIILIAICTSMNQIAHTVNIVLLYLQIMKITTKYILQGFEIIGMRRLIKPEFEMEAYTNIT